MGISQFEQDLLAELPPLRAFAWSLCRNDSLADDLVQETVIRAMAAQDRFDGANMAAWLFTICRNYYRSMWRRQIRREYELSDVVVETTAADLPSAEQQIDAAEALKRLIAGTRDEDHQLMMLLATDDLSYGDIAEVLGIPVGTVKSRLSRFRTRARAIINREPPGLVVKRKPRQYVRTDKWARAQEIFIAMRLARAGTIRASGVKEGRRKSGQPRKRKLGQPRKIGVFDALEESRVANR